MLINIMYQAGGFDMVKPQMLDILLREKKVARFKRSEGWAVVGHDPIRDSRGPVIYRGDERRLN